MTPNPVNQTAVDNFLGSLDTTLSEDEHIANAVRDAKSYGWNLATLNAIVAGVGKRYGKKEAV